MTSRTLTWTVRVAASLLSVVLLLVAAVLPILTTETGSRWALQQATDRLAADVEATTVNGTLWYGLRIGSLSYRDDLRDVRAADLVITIDWSALTRTQLTLRNIRAESIRYEEIDVPVAADTGKTTAIGIRIQRADIGQFILAGEGSDTNVADISVTELRAQDDTVRARRASATVDDFVIKLRRPELRRQDRLSLATEIDVAPADQAWSAQGIVSGSFDELDFDLAVEGSYPGQAQGTVFIAGRKQPDFVASYEWDVWAFDTLELSNGAMDMAGTVDGFSVDFRFTAAAAGLPPAVVNGSGTAANNELRCAPCRLALDRNTAEMTGTVSATRLDLRFDADIPAPEQILPGLAGSIGARGKISGPPANPLVEYIVAGRSFQYDGKPTRPIDFDAEGLLRSRAAGLVGTLARASVTDERLGRWSLAGETHFEVGRDTVSIAGHDWTGEIGTLHVELLDYRNDRLSLTASFPALPLQHLSPLLPAGTNLSGVSAADADLVYANGVWTGTANWRQQGAVFEALEADGEILTVIVPTAGLAAVFRDGGVSGTADMFVDPNVIAHLDFQLETLSAVTPLVASLTVEGDQLGWISALVPVVDRIGGAVTATINAGGTLDAPDLSGDLVWRDGSIFVPSLNVPLTEISLTVSGGARGSSQLTGTARAGHGELRVDGRLDDIFGAQRNLSARISGDTLELVRWPDYQLWATPDLVVSGNASGWQINGQITVPRAAIEVRELPTTAVVPSPDARIFGEAPSEQAATRITATTGLSFGDAVHVDAFGLNTRLDGNLLLRLTEDKPLRADGRVTLVDGVFGAYGRELTINRGALIFTGPLDNPLVDVRAVRVIETENGSVTAGIRLSGRARALTSTVFSEPAMSDADALSYLVIGRPLGQASASEGIDIVGAATTLGLRQATRLTEQVGRTLGFDQLSVAANEGEVTSFIAGKQINKRLHARYTYDVFSRLGSLLVRYRVSERLALEAGTGETQSIDMTYRVERD